MENKLIKLAVVAFCFAAVGCAGDPTPGTWNYQEYGASSNTCNYDDVISNGGGGFRLVDEGGGNYRVEPRDGSADFKCTYDGDMLDCPERAQESSSVSGYDATLLIDVDARATVVSSEEMEGTQDGLVACAGSDCSSLAALIGASLPCTFSVDFIAELQSAE